MAPRPSMNPSRGRGHFAGSCENLEPGKGTSAHGYEGHEAAQADLLASPERPEVCATALIGVRAKT
jgi:hypothetical protein